MRGHDEKSAVGKPPLRSEVGRGGGEVGRGRALGELGRGLALGFGVECGGQRGCGCSPGENFRGPTLSARIGSSRRRDGECAVMMKNRRLGNRRSVRKSDGAVKRSLITLFSDLSHTCCRPRFGFPGFQGRGVERSHLTPAMGAPDPALGAQCALKMRRTTVFCRSPLAGDCTFYRVTPS